MGRVVTQSTWDGYVRHFNEDRSSEFLSRSGWGSGLFDSSASSSSRTVILIQVE